MKLAPKKIFLKVLATVMVLATILCMASCGNKLSDPDKLIQHVEKEYFADGIENIQNIYNTVRTQLTFRNTTVRSSATLKVDETVTQLIEDAIGLKSTSDGWLGEFVNELKFDVKVTNNGKKYALEAQISKSDSHIATAKVVFDAELGRLYISVPGLIDEVYSLGVPSVGNANGIDIDVSFIFDIIEALDSLLSDDALSELIVKYIDILFNSLENTEKSEITLSAGTYKDDFTALKTNVSEKKIAEMIITLLEAAKADEDIKGYIKSFSSLISSFGGEGFADADSIINDYVSGVDSAIAEINKNLENLSETTLFVYIDYINAENEIIGRRVEIPDDKGPFDAVSYYSVYKDNEFGFEAFAENDGEKTLLLTGIGSRSDNKVTGSVDIDIEGKTIAIVEYYDFDTESIKNNYINGTFVLSPSSEIIESVIGTKLPFSMFGLKLGFSASENSKSTLISLVNGDNELVSVKFEYSVSAAEEISIPSESTENMNAWVSGISKMEALKLVGKLELPLELYTSILKDS